MSFNKKKWFFQLRKAPYFTVIAFLLFILTGCGISPEAVKSSISDEVVKKCESYGLEKVSVEVSGGKKDSGYQVFNMTVSSSNFESLSYDQMFQLNEELDSITFNPIDNAYIIIMTDYSSNGNTWNINESSLCIYKNHEEIYSDYNNSDSHRYVQEKYPLGIPVTDTSLKRDIWICAKNIVESNLKTPSTANFCTVSEASVYSNSENKYTVVGYVDAQNDFGAVIRNDFIVTLTFTGQGYTNGSVVFS